MFGKVTSLSGAQWFLVVNSNRLLLSQSILDTPPTYSLPTTPELSDWEYSDTQLFLNFTLSTPPTDEAWFIYTTPVNFIVNKKKRPLFRLTDWMLNGDSNHFEITSAWSSSHNCPYPPSTNVFAQIQAMIYSVSVSTGLSSPSMFSSQQIRLPI
jgi:hypothetical protein